MSRRISLDIGASVRRRLLNLAREAGEDFQLILTRFALERFLYRLGRSGHRESFLLKGAMLFRLWGGQPNRMTRDLDLHGYGDRAKQTQWRAFVRKNRLEDAHALSLAEVVAFLRGFLMQPSMVHARGEVFGLHWRPPGPWSA